MIYEPFTGIGMTALLPLAGLALLVTALVRAAWTKEK